MFNIIKTLSTIKTRFLNLLGLRETYSQSAEDLILYSNFRKNDGRYIDIGANDPKYINNFYLFYKKGWTGINVEPNFFLYKKLQKKRRKDINLNLGIGNGEKLDFYIMDSHTLSTFSSDTVNEYKKMGHVVKEIIPVQTITLENLFDKYWGEGFDFMSVDVEGYDLEVLKTNNWSKYSPTFIILETLEYSNDGTGSKTNKIFDEYLFERGYEKLADTFINTIYKLK